MNFTTHETGSQTDMACNAMHRALASGHRDDWITASRIWRRKLEDVELAQLTLAGLLALDDQMGSIVVSNALEDPEMPQPPFWSAMNEASDWASRADYRSVKACALAAFNRLTSSDQASFLDFVAERRAA